MLEEKLNLTYMDSKISFKSLKFVTDGTAAGAAGVKNLLLKYMNSVLQGRRESNKGKEIGRAHV